MRRQSWRAAALACAVLLACRAAGDAAPREGHRLLLWDGVAPAASAALGDAVNASGVLEGAVDAGGRRLHSGEEERVEKIGYVKTHKTGSTTLGAALFRFGARYHKRFYCQGRPPNACRKGHILAPGRPLPPGQVYDLQLNHLSGNGHLRGTFGSVIGWYKGMLGTEARTLSRRSGPPSRQQWALITPVRDPVSHYLSWFYYFGEPDNRMSVAQWANTGLGTNGLAAELGLYTEDDVRRFTAVMGWGHSAGPDVLGGALQLWLPVDRFDEGMLLLRHTLRWELIDITYTVLFDSRRHAAARWDGKLIKPTPKVSSLEPALVQRIAELNHLDGLLYGASVAAFEAGLAAARGAPGSVERVAWDADAAEFAAMQRALKRSFSVADESPACAELKAWYTLSDLQYEGMVGPDGYADVPPAAEVDAMVKAYKRSGGKVFC